MTSCKRCGHDPSARVVASWSFWIDKEIESLNAHRVNAGAKWQQAAYRHERDEWTRWMQVGKANAGITSPWQYHATGGRKRRVKLVRQYTGRQRTLDYDNLVGGAKSCVDAMVRAGILAGDTMELAEIDYVQRKGDARDKSGTWVIVEELAPEALEAIGAKR